MTAQEVSLKNTEKAVFRSIFDDGLVDIGISCFMLIFAIAPLLSETLGDLWSSMIFLPFWGLVYWVLKAIKRNMIIPRVGQVSFGSWRMARLKRFNLVMLIVNVTLLLLGIVAAQYFQPAGGAFPLVMGAVWLIGFSLGAIFLDYGMFYFYGLLYGLAPVVGEWLYRNAGAAHHGFPMAFGTACAITFMIGLFKLIRLLVKNPLPVLEA